MPADVAATAAVEAAGAFGPGGTHVYVDVSGSDSEWIEIKEKATSLHDEAVVAEQTTTTFLTEAEIVEVDDNPLVLQEMTDALAKVTTKEKQVLSFKEEAEIQTFEVESSSQACRRERRHHPDHRRLWP